MSIINTLRPTEKFGMLICKIGNREYKLMSGPTDSNVILFPIISVQDELLKQHAADRLNNTTHRKSSYEPLYAAIERQCLK